MLTIDHEDGTARTDLQQRWDDPAPPHPQLQEDELICSTESVPPPAPSLPFLHAALPPEPSHQSQHRLPMAAGVVSRIPVQARAVSPRTAAFRRGDAAPLPWTETARVRV